jgi:hypothetical protein
MDVDQTPPRLSVVSNPARFQCLITFGQGLQRMLQVSLIFLVKTRTPSPGGGAYWHYSCVYRTDNKKTRHFDECLTVVTPLEI